MIGNDIMGHAIETHLVTMCFVVYNAKKNSAVTMPIGNIPTIKDMASHTLHFVHESHLPVTPAQLMRPSTYWSTYMSCTTVDDFDNI